MSALTEAITRSRRSGADSDDGSPMRVLGRRQLSGYEVLAQSVATTAPAASMVVVPTMLLSHDSAIDGFALLGGVLLMTGLAAVALSQFTRRMVSPGGIYSFLFQGLGARGALLGGAAILLKYLASACMTLYHGSLAVTKVLDAAGIDADRVSVRIVVCLLITLAIGAALVRGVKLAMILILAIEATSLVFIIGLMIAAGGAEQVSVSGGIGPTALPFWLTVVFALAGFESATFLGAEAKRPYVTVTRAVLWTPVLCGALFVVAGWAAVTGRANALVEIYLYGTSDSTSGWVAPLLQTALAFSWLASAMASSNAASRIVFTMGLDRVLPNSLAAVSSRFRTPAAGIAASVAVSGSLAAVLTAGANLSLLPHIQPLTRVGLMLSYALVGAAALRFLRRIDELTPAVTVCCAVVVTVWLSGLAVLIGIDVSRDSYTVASAVVVLVLGAVMWREWLQRHSPWSLSVMGSFDRADSDDVLPGSASYGLDASGALVLVADPKRPGP